MGARLTGNIVFCSEIKGPVLPYCHGPSQGNIHRIGSHFILPIKRTIISDFAVFPNGRIKLKNPLPDRADPVELHLVWTCEKMPNAIAIIRAPWSVGDLERELLQLFLLRGVAEQKTLTVGGISIPTGAVARTHEIILRNTAQIFDLPGFDFHHDEVGF